MDESRTCTLRQKYRQLHQGLTDSTIDTYRNVSLRDLLPGHLLLLTPHGSSLHSLSPTLCTFLSLSLPFHPTFRSHHFSYVTYPINCSKRIRLPVARVYTNGHSQPLWQMKMGSDKVGLAELSFLYHCKASSNNSYLIHCNDILQLLSEWGICKAARQQECMSLIPNGKAEFHLALTTSRELGLLSDLFLLFFVFPSRSQSSKLFRCTGSGQFHPQSKLICNS
jgi:hypothetical protein